MSAVVDSLAVGVVAFAGAWWALQDIVTGWLLYVGVSPLTALVCSNVLTSYVAFIAISAVFVLSYGALCLAACVMLALCVSAMAVVFGPTICAFRYVETHPDAVKWPRAFVGAALAANVAIIAVAARWIELCIQ